MTTIQNQEKPQTNVDIPVIIFPSGEKIQVPPSYPSLPIPTVGINVYLGSGNGVSSAASLAQCSQLSTK